MYANKEKCPWNEDTCYFAAYHGKLNCLKYAIENKCPWNRKKCLESAVKNKKNEIINYINSLKRFTFFY
jgi:hypothetical protein